MKQDKRFELRISEELLKQIDSAKAELNRSEFIRRSIVNEIKKRLPGWKANITSKGGNNVLIN